MVTQNGIVPPVHNEEDESGFVSNLIAEGLVAAEKTLTNFKFKTMHVQLVSKKPNHVSKKTINWPSVLPKG